MDKRNYWVVGAAAAVTFAVFYSACALAIALWPETTLDFFSTWFHGVDLRLLQPASGAHFTFTQYLYGLLSLAVTTFFMGSLFAILLDKFQGHK